jgi:hypothetical protein
MAPEFFPFNDVLPRARAFRFVRDERAKAELSAQSICVDALRWGPLA